MQSTRRGKRPSSMLRNRWRADPRTRMGLRISNVVAAMNAESSIGQGDITVPGRTTNGGTACPGSSQTKSTTCPSPASRNRDLKASTDRLALPAVEGVENPFTKLIAVLCQVLPCHHSHSNHAHHLDAHGGSGIAVQAVTQRLCLGLHLVQCIPKPLRLVLTRSVRMATILAFRSARYLSRNCGAIALNFRQSASMLVGV